MKLRNVFAAGLIAASLLPTFAKAADITFDVVSTPVIAGNAAKIEFKGSPLFSIAFPNAGNGFDFTISNGSDSGFDGLSGNIGGTFTVGAITINGPMQDAPVTGTGIFSIFDGATTLTAALTWDSIFSVGTTTALNFNAVANLTNVTYAGTNAALQSIVTSIDPTFNLSAQFGRTMSLTQLMTAAHTTTTTYSGSFAAQPVPEPSTYALMIAGLAVAGVAARRRKAA